MAIRTILSHYANLAGVTHSNTFSESSFNKELLELRLERAAFDHAEDASATMSRYGIWSATVRDRLRYLAANINDLSTADLTADLVTLCNSMAAFTDIQAFLDMQFSFYTQEEILSFRSDRSAKTERILSGILCTLEDVGFSLQEYLKRMVHLQAIENRRQGKHFSFAEHLSGLVYSQLSNQRPWGPIVANRDKIDAIFCHFDPDFVLRSDKKALAQALADIKCGNRAILAQMKALDRNIAVLRQIEEVYGSLDAFITSGTPEKIACQLGESGTYKLGQIGFTLALEYLRNVGIDAAKPDVHLKRFITRLSLCEGEPTEQQALDVLSLMAKDTNTSISYLDALIWGFCAVDEANVCGSTPKCHICRLKEICNETHIEL